MTEAKKLLLRIGEAGDAVGCARTMAYQMVKVGEWETVDTPYGRRVVAASLENWVARKVAEQTR